MAIVEVKVPQLSESVSEATLLQWKKKPGEAVAMDEILIEIETDKVVLEVPAPAGGGLPQNVKAEGAKVPPGDVIATLDTEGKASAAPAGASAATAKAPPPAQAPAPAVAASMSGSAASVAIAAGAKRRAG